jgi:hypothetical protein
MVRFSPARLSVAATFPTLTPCTRIIDFVEYFRTNMARPFKRTFQGKPLET